MPGASVKIRAVHCALTVVDCPPEETAWIEIPYVKGNLLSANETCFQEEEICFQQNERLDFTKPVQFSYFPHFPKFNFRTLIILRTQLSLSAAQHELGLPYNSTAARPFSLGGHGCEHPAAPPTVVSRPAQQLRDQLPRDQLLLRSVPKEATT